MLFLCVLALCASFLIGGRANADSPVPQLVPEPSSGLLLPYFRVGLNNDLTTTFSLGNAQENPSTAIIGVYSNWGIRVLYLPVNIAGKNVKTFDIGSWLKTGKLPDGSQLSEDQLLKVQAQLSGKVPPSDTFYYSTPTVPDEMSGYITIVPQIYSSFELWGDYAYANDEVHALRGERLVRLYSYNCGELCKYRILRFDQDLDSDINTYFVVWSYSQVFSRPSISSHPDQSILNYVTVTAFSQEGEYLGSQEMQMLPVQPIKVSDLNLPKPFGWLEISSSESDMAISAFYTKPKALQGSLITTWCLPEPPPTQPPTTPTPNPTTTPTPPTPTPTCTRTPTPPTPTPTCTHTPTPPTPTPTCTPTPTGTPTPPTPTPTPTCTPTPTGTPTPTPTPTCTRTPTPPVGLQGCSPGYWKNHPQSWTGFSPNQMLTSVFSGASLYDPTEGASMMQALNFGGGTGLDGAAKILARSAVAAVLNASNSSVDYPLTVSQVVQIVNGAFMSHSRDAMLSVASQLDEYNNLGCPLS